TYTRAGLPPTPIAMPGRDSVKATLHPANTPALYFVSRGDGTHIFTATLEEHNAAVTKYQLGGRIGAATTAPKPKSSKNRKSTQLRAIKDWLEARGRQVVVTREPVGTELGEKVRGVLLHQAGEISADAEVL